LLRVTVCIHSFPARNPTPWEVPTLRVEIEVMPMHNLCLTAFSWEQDKHVNMFSMSLSPLKISPIGNDGGSTSGIE
jgi:hypothetical protein